MEFLSFFAEHFTVCVDVSCGGAFGMGRESGLRGCLGSHMDGSLFGRGGFCFTMGP